MNNPLKPVPTKPDPNTSESWKKSALCAQIDPDIHFPTGRAGKNGARDAQTRLAIRICEACPVLQECRDYAIKTGEQNGVWGGLNEKQLSVLARRSRRERAA